MKNQLVLVVDFGGQYNQLIVRRVRNLGVYAEMVPADITAEKIREKNPIGIIFTGGPASVFGEDYPQGHERDIFARSARSGNMLRYAAYSASAGRRGGSRRRKTA